MLKKGASRNALSLVGGEKGGLGIKVGKGKKGREVSVFLVLLHTIGLIHPELGGWMGRRDGGVCSLSAGGDDGSQKPESDEDTH